MLSLEELNNVSEIDIVYKKKITGKVSERPLIRFQMTVTRFVNITGMKIKIELLEEFKVPIS